MTLAILILVRTNANGIAQLEMPLANALLLRIIIIYNYEVSPSLGRNGGYLPYLVIRIYISAPGNEQTYRDYCEIENSRP